MQFDAVLVPGGGLRGPADLQPWAEARLGKVLQDYPHERVILLSAGTTHKAPPQDKAGFPVFESMAGARYLLRHGFDSQNIFTETCSYDTIGNGYFARVIHTDIAGWHRLHVVTSAFHLARTQETFNWIFGLNDAEKRYKLTYEAVQDEGIEQEVLAERIAKEAQGVENVRALRKQLTNLAQLHQWLYMQHAAYAVGLYTERMDAQPVSWQESY